MIEFCQAEDSFEVEYISSQNFSKIEFLPIVAANLDNYFEDSEKLLAAPACQKSSILNY